MGTFCVYNLGKNETLDSVKDRITPLMKRFDKKLFEANGDFVYQGDNKFAGYYDTTKDEIYYLSKNNVHNETDTKGLLNSGITKFSYIHYPEGIIGIIVAKNELLARKTIQRLKKEKRGFIPVYYSCEIEDNNGKTIIINLNEHLDAVYSHIDDYYLSPNNYRKTILEYQQINKDIDEILRIAGINSCNS